MPPWPTTPFNKNGNSVANDLLRASSPVPRVPDKGPTQGLYGKEPQIYGQPEPGLISPRETTSSDGQNFEKPEPYLRVRVSGLDRNRRDILVKLDAQTNLSNFTGTTYRNVSRSYVEFQMFYETIAQSNPQTIIPALPHPQTSAPTDEEDDRIVRIMLQRWLTRVCEDPILLGDEDLRSFIESDFGYQPTPRPKKKTTSGFSLMRRGVPDEDEELQRARFELTKLEGQFFETAKTVDKIALARKSLSLAHTEMGHKLISVATTETHPHLSNALRKFGRTWHSLSDLDQAQAISECVIMGDSLGYQALNARSAKETLQQRTGVLDEYQAAVKTTISKRRQIERLKASSNIQAHRVDEALEDLEEAHKYEQVLAKRAEGISLNLHRALEVHNRHANDDITAALIENARSTLMYEKQHLRELESLRADVANAANKVEVPVIVPRPSFVPPLEDFSKSHPAANVPSSSNDRFTPARQPPPSQPSPSSPPFSRNSFASQQTSAPIPDSPQSYLHTPASADAPRPFGPGPISPLHPNHPGSQPSTSTKPLQSPGAGPSRAAFSPNVPRSSVSEGGPPLGGRFVDGTKSMIVTSSSSFVRPTLSRPSQTNGGPQRPQSAAAHQPPVKVTGEPYDPLSAPVTPSASHTNGASPLSPAPASNDYEGLDPLGQAKPQLMTGSVRLPPTRSRLDAKEAASKLANMF